MEENARTKSPNSGFLFCIYKIKFFLVIDRVFHLVLFQAQLKLADHLRKMGEQGKDLEGMDVDLDELRANLSKFKKYGKGFDVNDLDWLDSRRKIKAVTIFFYETSV